MFKRKGCFITIAAIVVLLILVTAFFSIYPHFARIVWKNRSIAEINAFTGDRDKLEASVATLEKERLRRDGGANTPLGAGWLSGDLILMKNGEWLAYRCANAHESPRISDHFIAKGSDGKWYYTSNHFCKGMLCLLQEMDFKAPPSLAFFIRVYNLREFDGKSNDCLSPTSFSPDWGALSELSNQNQ
jgi:hypothetical protein